MSGGEQEPTRGHGRDSPVVGVALVVGLFGVAFVCGTLVVRALASGLGAGDPGTFSRLLVSIAGLQVVGFGGVTVLYLRIRPVDWRSSLRLGGVSEMTAFYGAAVGLALMIVTVLATGVFHLFDIEPAESPVAVAEEPLFYVGLFVLSTFVAVPLEEVFFRGILQRRLEEQFHTALAIGVASVLFVLIHTGVSVGSGGGLIVFGLYLAFGVVLGTSYYLTKNLFVPIIGHAIFNGVQILLRAIEVAL